MFIKKTCENFVDELASKAPVPGGGGAAALSGALAAALSSMVCNLTMGKKKYEDVQQKISELLCDTEMLRYNLLQLIDEDAYVFGELMQAYKLPKSSPEELCARNAMLSEKSMAAAQVPWQIAQYCERVLDLAQQVADIGNIQAISDAAVSAILARAALRSACYNVLINLGSIEDQAYISEKLAEMQAIQERAEEKEREVLKKTDKVLAIC